MAKALTVFRPAKAQLIPRNGNIRAREAWGLPLLFPMLSYNSDGKGGVEKYLDKKMNCGLIYTMNVTPENYKAFGYEAILSSDRNFLQAYYGHCEVLKVHGTWQFYPDYSKYDHSAVDLDEKQWYRENQWPKDKEAAFEMGKRLVTKE